MFEHLVRTKTYDKLPEFSSPLCNDYGADEVHQHRQEHDHAEVDVELNCEVDHCHSDVDQGRQNVEQDILKSENILKHYSK